MTQFFSKPITPRGGAFDTDTMSHGEPALPPAFTVGEDELVVADVVRTWKGHKQDRGDTYVKRHYFEFRVRDGRTAVVYFDRGERRGAPRWFLYTLTEDGAKS